MVPFGAFGLFIMYVTNPFFMGIITSIVSGLRYFICVILIIVYVVDNILSFKIIKNIQNVSRNVQKKQIIKKDDTERITELVRKQVESSMKMLEKRIIHAFPHLQVLKDIKRKKKW